MEGAIKTWNEEERPREKLLNKGPAALTNAELIAIIIGSGTKDLSAVEVSRDLIRLGGSKLSGLMKLNISALTKIKGIGLVKAIGISANLELAKRMHNEQADNEVIIRSSSDAFKHVQYELYGLDHEEFWILLLNKGNRIIGKQRISSGGVSGTVADTRMIFKTSVEHLATGLILFHNHPSGNLKPSEADIKLTRKLTDAGRLLDVAVLDHLILSNNNYYSFADEGRL